jgi:hypothetical protein
MFIGQPGLGFIKERYPKIFECINLVISLENKPIIRVNQINTKVRDKGFPLIVAKEIEFIDSTYSEIIGQPMDIV